MTQSSGCLRLRYTRNGVAKTVAQRPGVLACRIQEPSNRTLDFVILALARVAEHDVAALVDDILSRPVLIAPSIPRRGLVVLRHRIGDAMAFYRQAFARICSHARSRAKNSSPRRSGPHLSRREHRGPRIRAELHSAVASTPSDLLRSEGNAGRADGRFSFQAV
jgi:hypothetical protein